MEPIVLTQQEKDIANSGDFIYAIKLVRERTNTTLKDAKDVVDAYRSNAPEYQMMVLKRELEIARTRIKELEAELRGVYNTMDKLGKKSKVKADGNS